jgi:uncharacterized protein YjbI with pentapeptide repeats
MAIHVFLPGFRLLKGSTTQPKEFACSVKSGSTSDLSGADLTEADLCEVYLSESWIVGAFFSESRHINSANLRETKLSGADLSGANLEGVIGITREDWVYKVRLLYGAATPDGSIYPMP